MRYMVIRFVAMLIGAVVLGAAVAASAQVVTRDQIRQFFQGGAPYNQGFRDGYAAGVADAARAVYVNPGVVTQGVVVCTQQRAFPSLAQLANAALQQWLAGTSPNAAVQVLGIYNVCTVAAPKSEPDREH